MGFWGFGNGWIVIHENVIRKCHHSWHNIRFFQDN